MRFGLSAIAVVAWLCVPAAPLSAGEVRAEMGRLLEAGKQKSPDAIAAAQDAYRSLKQSHPHDARVDYAYGLVLLAQRDYGAALELVESYAKAHREDLEAQRVRLWALVQNRRDKDALSEAVALAGALPKDAAGREAAESAETARFLGGIFGYLERARIEAVDRELKMRRTNELLAALGDAYLPAFDEGRAQAWGRFDELRQKQQAAEQARSQSRQDRQQEIDTALNDGKVFLETQRHLADSSGERVQDARRRLDVIAQQIAALAQDRARLTAQIMTTQALVQDQSAPRSRTIVDDNVADPNAGTLRVNTVTAVSGERTARVQYLALMLAMLNRQAFNLDRRIAALQADAATAMSRGLQEGRTLAQSADAIRKTQRRAAALEYQARKLEARPAAPRRVTVEMTRLATYLPLDYEQESKRVLSWFEE